MIFTSKKFRSLPVMAMFLVLLSCEVSSGGSGSPDVPDTPADGIYQFHSKVEYLPEGTDGTAGTSGTYCYFGDWPQTIKAENVSINEKMSKSIGSFTYYMGSDGNWYAKCKEIGRYEAMVPDAFYSDGTSVDRDSGNNYKYFKVEPIKWRILTDNYNGNKLLFAESVLMANVSYYIQANGERTINDATVYANNYEHSMVRAYLNGLSYEKTDFESGDQETDSGFLNKGFFSDSI